MGFEKTLNLAQQSQTLHLRRKNSLLRVFTCDADNLAILSLSSQAPTRIA